MALKAIEFNRVCLGTPALNQQDAHQLRRAVAAPPLFRAWVSSFNGDPDNRMQYSVERLNTAAQSEGAPPVALVLRLALSCVLVTNQWPHDVAAIRGHPVGWAQIHPTWSILTRPPGSGIDDCTLMDSPDVLGAKSSPSDLRERGKPWELGADLVFDVRACTG